MTKIKMNPRGRVRNWKAVLSKIESARKRGASLETACAGIPIAYSTYHEWKKRLQAEKNS